MARLLPSVRGESEEAEPTLDVTVEREDSTRRKGLRKAVLGLGLLGLAYVASRRAGSGEIAPDELREKASDGLPADEDESMTEFVEKEIEGGDAEDAEDQSEDAAEDEGEAGDDAESESDTAESGGEPIAEDLPGEERSDEEIEGRAEEDAHEEPAEPGEMHVDEDVVDEVVDDDEESG